MNDLILTKVDRARLLLAEAKDAADAKQVMDMAHAAEIYAKRQKLSDEAIGYAHEIKIEAQRLLGEFLEKAEKLGPKHSRGGGSKGSRRKPLPNAPPSLSEVGISKQESFQAQFVSRLAREAPEQFEAVRQGKTTVSRARRELKRQETKAHLEEVAKVQPENPEGKFDVMVIDPAWPVEKIERDVRPAQVGFDYPTMAVEEIMKLELVSQFAAENCHVFLWTTQKMLPFAFQVLDAWGLRYVLTFVWHKPGGFQPIGLPQFNCEFCLYARKGKLEFTDTKNFFTCFEAPRGKHSEKPEEFYALLRRVTAGRRLDCFNRRKIEGFIGWGKEAG